MGHTIKTQFDIPKMMEIYSVHKNYEIIDRNNNDQNCIIYFSGHGIYYPNTEDTFYEKIIKNNYYEWENNVLSSARKVILVRDVTKQWYINGINIEVNTIEKLYAFLKKHTEGLRVICVGNSAGGYAATLIGCLLHASHVYNFSGYFSIWDLLDDEMNRALNPEVVKCQDKFEYNRYYSIIDLLHSSNVPIFYFYPSKSDYDLKQSKLIEDIKNVYKFAFDSSVHGKTCYGLNYQDLFQLDNYKLVKLQSIWKETIIKRINFSIRVSGLFKTIRYILKIYTHKI